MVGALAFLALGLLIAMITRNARAAQAIGMILFFPFFLLSGAGPPPDVMSSGMRSVSDVIPLTFAVRALQDPWIGEGQNGISLALLAAMAVIATAATFWIAGKKT
jgi:ABC-2 type transport system permease protein